jgi:hypothetical protein
MSNKKTTPIVEIIEDEILPAEVEEIETAEEIIEAAVVEDVVKSGEYVVADGDTYAVLGKKFVKSGETPFEAANRIMTANGGKSLVAGEVVKF